MICHYHFLCAVSVYHILDAIFMSHTMCHMRCAMFIPLHVTWHVIYVMGCMCHVSWITQHTIHHLPHQYMDMHIILLHVCMWCTTCTRIIHVHWYWFPACSLVLSRIILHPSRSTYWYLGLARALSSSPLSSPLSLAQENRVDGLDRWTPSLSLSSHQECFSFASNYWGYGNQSFWGSTPCSKCGKDGQPASRPASQAAGQQGAEQAGMQPDSQTARQPDSQTARQPDSLVSEAAARQATGHVVRVLLVLNSRTFSDQLIT